MHIQHPDANPLFLQRIGGGDCERDGAACGDNSHIVALMGDDGLTDLILVILRVDQRLGAPSNPDTHGAGVIHALLDQFDALIGVAGNDEGHIGEGTHDRDIHNVIVGRTTGRGQARVGIDDTHWQIRIADIGMHLIQSAQG